MPVTFSNFTSAFSNVTSNYVSVMHTVSGENRIVIAMVQAQRGAGTSVISAALGGVTMTSLVSMTHPSNAAQNITVYELVNPATAATVSFLVSFNLAARYVIGLWTFTCAAQSSLVSYLASVLISAGASITATVSEAAGGLLLFPVAKAGTAEPSPTTGTYFVQSATHWGGAAYLFACATSSRTVAWEWTGSNTANMLVFHISEAVAATSAFVTQGTIEALVAPSAAAKVTQGVVEVLASPSAAAKITQGTLEVLASPSAAAKVTQGVLEALVVVPPSAVGLTAQLVWIVSGTSTVANVIIAPSTTISAEWIVSGGVSPFTYSYTLTDMVNVAGFVSTATTSAITRTYTNAGGPDGTRRVSSTVSDASAASVTSAILVHMRATVMPNPLDGVIQYESQYRRLIIPT